MRNKRKFIIIILLTLITIPFKVYIPQIVKADSGFDSSYDSSSSSSSWGSSSSGSSWGSSDYSNDNYSSSNNNYRSYYSSNTDDESTSNSSFDDIDFKLIGFLLVAFIIVYIFILFIIYNYRTSKTTIIKTEPFNLELFKQLCPNQTVEEFLNDRYNDFLEIQKSWMDFDYEKLKSHLTDELYNQYEMQLETLKVKNQKNIMSDFKIRYQNIANVKLENDIAMIETHLAVEFYDYIEEANKVIRGSNYKKIRMYYKLTFTSNLNQEKLDKCPNCGAKIEHEGIENCEYCRALLTTPVTSWIMSKKEVLKQENL